MRFIYTGDMTQTKPEVNLGKAAIFFVVLAVFGIAAGTVVPIFGFVGIIALIAAVGLAGLHFAVKAKLRKP